MPVGDSMGLSLEELEQLGREAGIPPDLIRKSGSCKRASLAPVEKRKTGSVVRSLIRMN